MGENNINGSAYAVKILSAYSRLLGICELIMNFPDDIDRLKKKIEKIIYPIASAVEKGTKVEEDFLFTASRTDAGRSLPPFYLVYFLFVDLLGYKDIGRFEKIAWSVPIDYNGTAYLLEHRKFGVGLFASDKENQEADCLTIVEKITKAVKAARPYFEWIAKKAAERSDSNVLNHSLLLHDRYSYFIDEYRKKIQEADTRKDEKIRTQHSENHFTVKIPYFNLKNESEWLAIAAIDSFFSFSEHVFIHAAILRGVASTVVDVANLVKKEWALKFKACLDIKDPDIKAHYDQLMSIKRQIRNYMAHGAFGKNGEIFQFHSGAGAVPLLMPHQKDSSRFSIQRGIEVNEKETIESIEKFMKFYWKPTNKFPEVTYIQSGMPSILPYASDSTYARAMSSVNNMKNFVEAIVDRHDNAANMDW